MQTSHSPIAPCRLLHSVLDINQALVDDGLVDKDKIGGSNYFWSFPAKKDRLLQLEHEATLCDIIVLKEQTVLASAKLADAKRGREDEGGDRVAKLARLAELTKQHAALQTEYEALKENDPQALADLQKELELVKNAANRWTDNIFNCKTYLVKKRGMDKKEAIKILGITPAFDCKLPNVLCILFSPQNHLIQIELADRPRGQDSEVEYGRDASKFRHWGARCARKRCINYKP